MNVSTVLPHADLHHPAVEAALSTATALLGMQMVFIGGLSDEEFVFERVHGELPGAIEGLALARGDSLCSRLLDGAPTHTADAANEPAYADAPAREAFNIKSYVGIPLNVGSENLAGTLCGLDSDSVTIPEALINVLRELAHVIEAHVAPVEQPVIRRDEDGWHVGGDNSDDQDLLSAMVLADLLAPTPKTGSAPSAAGLEDSEVERLQITVQQLEHALSARVAVEQAIGVLVERQHLLPRAAFERLRRAARSRGRKVAELAREVVASSIDHSVPLPPELAGRH